MRGLGFRPHFQRHLQFLQHQHKAKTRSKFQVRSYKDSSRQGLQASTSLRSRELHRAALLARLSGLCYHPPDQLEWRLQKEGLKLVTAGDTPFTRWYIADGVLDKSSSSAASSTSTDRESRLGVDRAAAMNNSEVEVERIIMLRGVVWRGEGVDSFKLWQDLMRFWPTAFAREHTRPEGVILAHAGAADMAERLYDTLKVAVEEGKALNRRIVFGGHSLGGSLGLCLCVLYKLRLNLKNPQTVTFGSPPVLSHKLSRGGDGVMQVLGLERSAIRNYVLENDPVPRALLSIDPTFTALKQNRAGAAFLQLRQWLVGPTALTPDRFLADNVGEVHLLKWSAEHGHQVTALEPEEIEKALLEAAGGAASSFQRVVDHAHGSYSTDLDAAAWQLEMKGL